MSKLSEILDLYDNYLDSVRLFMWYQGSPASFHQGKTDQAWAEKYRKFAHYYLAEIRKELAKHQAK